MSSWHSGHRSKTVREKSVDRDKGPKDGCWRAPTFRGWGEEPDLAEGSELVMLVMAGPGLGRFT